MTPWTLVDSDRLRGGSQLSLYERDGSFMLRTDGLELMTSDAHRSEEVFVSLGFEAFGGEPSGGKSAQHILIGGLGFGYTLGEACKQAPESCVISVVEISARVIAWNEGPLAALHPHLMADPRTQIICADLVAHIEALDAPVDIALLDIDNGPEALVRPGNGRLYSEEGLALLATKISPHGTVVFWSAFASNDFETRLKACFEEVETRCCPLPQNPRIEHFFFVARRPNRPGPTR